MFACLTVQFFLHFMLMYIVLPTRSFSGYMCAANLIEPLPDHANSMVAFGLSILKIASETITPLGEPLQVRVGIHTGPLLSGVLGWNRFKFTLVRTPAQLPSCVLTYLNV